MEAGAEGVTRLVVGDGYERFARTVDAITVSEVSEESTAGIRSGTGTFVLGQGFDDDALARLRGAIASMPPADRLSLIGDVRPVESALCHKSDRRNVLLADLVVTGPQAVSAALSLHADNEFVLDHQTGLHVQGMVVVEFARQLVLAACERLDLLARFDRPRFVINTMTTQFDGFLFPVPARGDLTITDFEHRRSRTARLTAGVDVMQAGVRAARVVFEAGVFEADRIHALEMQQAMTAAAGVRGARADA